MLFPPSKVPCLLQPERDPLQGRARSDAAWPQNGPKTKNAESAPRANSAQSLSCAGPQLDFPVQQVQGVADAWVPFDESIAIGWD
jgi:hypothetical protein